MGNMFFKLYTLAAVAAIMDEGERHFLHERGGRSTGYGVTPIIPIGKGEASKQGQKDWCIKGYWVKAATKKAAMKKAQKLINAERHDHH